MALYFAGGEDIDFPLGSAIAIGTTSGTHYRAGGYARCGVKSAGARSNVFTAGVQTSCWLSFRWAQTNGVFGALLCAGVVSGSTTNKGIWVGSDASTGLKIVIFKYDGTTKTALATTASNIFSASSGILILKIDLQIVSYGASSTLNLYINGVLVATFSGDCTVSGVTNFDSVGLGGDHTQTNGMSELIVASEDTRNFSLLTMAPTGVGTTADWAGTYTDIDETTLSDADVVSSNTASQDEQYNATNTPAGSFSVPYIVVKARATKDVVAAATTVALGVNHGGSIDAGTPQAMTTSWDTYERSMATNPVTAAAWTQSDIDSLQINLRSGL